MLFYGPRELRVEGPPRLAVHNLDAFHLVFCGSVPAHGEDCGRTGQRENTVTFTQVELESWFTPSRLNLFGRAPSGLGKPYSISRFL